MDYIKTDNLDHQFDEHLDIDSNERIVFSAKFGDGKTTFLKHFFESNDDKYEVIHLYPVNYSVASNEDIFELVKYDILLELLTKKIEFENVKPVLSHFAAKYAKGNKFKLIKLFTPFLKVIPLLGESTQETVEGLIDELESFTNEYQAEKKGEIEKSKDYLRSFTEKIGSIYEENFYTKLISQLVLRLKEKDGVPNKKTILIIDDLDRIDPEHIFRILNVFAAHQDTVKHGNKFNFDKVIVVCDIDNIRSIFHYKYGINTDFNGYMDKFFSIDVFKYSMKDELLDKAEKILAAIRGNNLFIDHFNPGTIFFNELSWLIRSFIVNDIINVRNVLKFETSSIILKPYDLGFGRTNNTQYWGLILFQILKKFFGDYHELLKAFEKFGKIDNLIKQDNRLDNEPALNYFLIPLLAAFKGVVDNDVDIYIPIENTGNPVKVSYIIKSNIHNKYHVIAAGIKPGQNENPVNVNMNDLFYKVYEGCLLRGYLR